MTTHTFHVSTPPGYTYKFEEADGYLGSVTIHTGGKDIMHSRPGHLVKLHDIEVRIGESLADKATTHPELGLILGKIAAGKKAA